MSIVVVSSTPNSTRNTSHILSSISHLLSDYVYYYTSVLYILQAKYIFYSHCIHAKKGRIVAPVAQLVGNSDTFSSSVFPNNSRHIIVKCSLPDACYCFFKTKRIDHIERIIAHAPCRSLISKPPVTISKIARYMRMSSIFKQQPG